jgi:hypothetical protein
MQTILGRILRRKNATVKKDVTKSFSHRQIGKLTILELKKVLQTMKDSKIIEQIC